jgi:glycosyltransferase involved in cell wall biosynthesis
MKISLCIPQYNRIKFLLYNLQEIAKQPYDNIEIVISDDCSKDNTKEAIEAIKADYKYPITYFRQSTNQGYDRNLRTSIELAQGDYVILLGNDDTINPDYDLGQLVKFLESNHYPDVGYTSFIEADTNKLEPRAAATAIIGSGPEVAFTHYSRFSFVGGIIFRRSTYMKYNTPKFDGSVYTQIYHSSLIIASGGILFSIAEPVVVKDILPLEQNRASYTDKIARKWSDYKRANGGLPTVIRVSITAFEDAGVLNQKIIYGIFRKIYGSTLPYWMVNYRMNRALPESVGLMVGMRPPGVDEYHRLNLGNRIKINVLYSITSVSALLVPVFMFEYFKGKLWKMANKTQPL